MGLEIWWGWLLAPGLALWFFGSFSFDLGFRGEFGWFVGTGWFWTCLRDFW